MAHANKTERIELRATQSHRELIDRATTLSGLSSRSDFVMQAALKNAQEIIDENNSIKLSNEAFDNFVAACENPPEPNQALKEALNRTRESGIG